MHRGVQNVVKAGVCLVLALSFLGLNLSAWSVVVNAQANQHIFRSDFRYVILSNEIARTGKKYRDRSVQVLLDRDAFSEQNLTKLFQLLLKRYPEPDWMSVSVVTSLEQVATPEEAEREITMSHTNNHPDFDNYESAVLIRHAENEFLRYTIKAPGTEMRTVVIKGCDSATSKCAN